MEVRAFVCVHQTVKLRAGETQQICDQRDETTFVFLEHDMSFVDWIDHVLQEGMFRDVVHLRKVLYFDSGPLLFLLRNFII